jgi:hypothetical protein
MGHCMAHPVTNPANDIDVPLLRRQLHLQP